MLNGEVYSVAERHMWSILNSIGQKQKLDKLLSLKFKLVNKSIRIVDCPMLFWIVCLLLYNYQMMISEEITIGELFFKLVIFLYTKTKASKEASGNFNSKEFRNFLFKTGELSFQNLWLKDTLEVDHVRDKLREDFEFIDGFMHETELEDGKVFEFDDSTMQQFVAAISVMRFLKGCISVLQK